MSYTALYRKFRPATFAQVKGQDHIVTTLRNQLKAERMGHAYLFTGTRGTGKTSVAKIFAKAVNCMHPTEDGPCMECEICKSIDSGSSMNVIEIDAASNNGVDNIREIVEEVSYSPTRGKYKVYIIDEVHMLSIGAFNALLKTLEEPPSYVIFILATTEVHKLPITILSRCQRYDFKRITIDTIVDRMRELVTAEKVAVEEKALRFIAKTADGSMRDALSLLDQCIAFHLESELTYDKALDVLGSVDAGVFSELFRKVLTRDVLGCISLLEEIVMQGRDLPQFVTDFTWYLRNLMLVSASDTLEDVIDMSSENLLRLKEEAEQVEMDQIIRYIHIFSDLAGQIKYASQKRILVEIALIKLCKPEMESSREALTDRIRQVEEKLEKGDIIPREFSGMQVESAMPVKEKKKLEKAVPEEVQRVVTQWQMIVGNTDFPMKGYLKSARLSLGNENELIVVVEDGLASDYFLENDDHRIHLEEIIADIIKKEVKVTIQAVHDDREFEENFVDLAGLIHMEVQEEDE